MKKKGRKTKKPRHKKTTLTKDEANTLLASVRQCLSTKQYTKAETICKKILTTSPGNIDALHLSGTIALITKQPERAIQLLKKAVGLEQNLPEIHCNLGLAHEARHDFSSAQKGYQKALKIQADFFEALLNLGSLKLKMLFYEDSYTLLKKAAQIRPQRHETLLLLGLAASKTGRLKESISCYETYLSHCQPITSQHLPNFLNQDNIFPAHEIPTNQPLPEKNIHIKAKLADLYERSNQKQKAKQTAYEVLRYTPQHLLANLIIARIDRQAGRLDRALERLEQFVDTTKGDDILAEIMAERGTILDRMNRFDDAFAAFSLANKIMGQTDLAAKIDTTSIHHTISSNKAYFQKNHSRQKYEPTGNEKQPVFLVGFPRSGTTLLEQIIASRMGFDTSDELPVLDDITKNITTLLGRDMHLPEDLNRLRTDDIKKIRSFYWHQIENKIGIIPDKNLFLDKQPLNLLHIGFIEKSFPDSKIILLLRDPRDVCLSNFLQMFALNEAMIHFLNIKSTVDFYCEVMGLWLTYKNTIQSNYLEIKYENLVTKPAETIERLCSFLLPDPADPHKGTDHIQCATKKVISTPSYHDVTQPIYTRAVSRWKNYRKHLEPHFDKLERFIVAFGYDK